MTAIPCHSNKGGAKRAAERLAQLHPALAVSDPLSQQHWLPVLVVADGVDETELPPDVRGRAILTHPDGSTFHRVRSVTPAKPGKPAGNMEEKIKAMLRRKSGATIKELGGRFGWLPHSIRSYLSTHAKKEGWHVEKEKTARGVVYRLVDPPTQH